MAFKFQMKIVNGEVSNEIPLIAVKSYPTRIFEETENIRIAYADILNGEKNTLGIQYNAKGIKNNEKPQIIFFVKGDYHKEFLRYYSKNPMEWSTWIEFVLDIQNLNELIITLIKIRNKINIDRVISESKNE